jgi:hypothetical protein
MKLYLIATLALITLTGCKIPKSYAYIEGFFGSTSSDTISGTFEIDSTLALSSDWTVELFSLDDQSTVLAIGEMDWSTKSYTIKTQDAKLEDQPSYLVRMRNSSNAEEISRIVTDLNDQNIDTTSSLISFMATLPEDQRSIPARQELHAYMKNLQTEFKGEKLKSKIYERLVNNSEFSSAFSSLFGMEVNSLVRVPPKLIRHTIPSSFQENASYQLSILASHWHPDYKIAYLVQLSGEQIATNHNFSFTPSADSQGQHVIKIYLGAKDSSGDLDHSRPMNVTELEVEIENTLAAQAPSFKVQNTPAFTNTRSLTLEISTDAFKQACASFDTFAITENTTIVPPLMAFVHRCTEEGTQELSYTLSTAGDGLKTLRLYTMDSSGLISTSFSSISIGLDTTPPTGSIIAFPAVIKGGLSRTLSYSIQDSGSGLQSLMLEYSNDNAASFASIASLNVSSSSHSVNIEASDIASAVFRIIATDNLGHSATFVQPTAFAIDATAPAAPSVTRHSPALTNSAAISFTAANCTDTQDILVLEAATTPNGSEAGWQACTTAAGALTHTLSNTTYGLKTLYLWAKDSAGNVSVSSTDLTVTIDIANPIINIAALNSYYRASESVDLEWTLTENQATSANNFTIELSTNGGTSWTAAGTAAGHNGSASAMAFSSNITLPASAGTQYRYRVSLTDEAGNTGTAMSSVFTIDTQAPSISAVSVNNGATVIGKNNLSITMTASDNHGLTAIRIKERSSSCQGDYADTDWIAYTGSGPYSFLSSNINGEKVLCFWAKDLAGNVSVITANAGEGTHGVDRYAFIMDVGEPPTFLSVSAINNNSASAHYQSTTVENGDQVLISWSISDSGGLAESPINIQVTTNGTAYTTIAENLGNLADGTTSWSSSYSGYTATGSGFLRFRVIAKDAVDNTAAVLTAPLNTGAWSVYAGTNDIGNDGTALSARLGPLNGSFTYDKQLVAATVNDDIYVSDGSNQIRRIDSSTGIISRYLSLGTELNVPGPVADARIPAMNGRAGTNLLSDGSHMIYVLGGTRIYRINTLNHTVERYAGGGTSLAEGAPGIEASIFQYAPLAINPINKDIFYAAKCHGVNALMIYKVSQNSDGTAGTISHFAGKCEIGAIGNNELAKESPLNSSSTYWNNIMFAYVPTVDALYAWIYPSRLIKIIDGKIFNRSAGWGVAMIYSPQHNKLFFNNRSLVPTSSQSVEDDQIEIGTSNQVGCNSDTAMKLSACATFHGATINSSGNLVFSDGIQTNQTSSFRIRRLDDDGYVRTVAGARAFSGIGDSATVSRFGVLQTLRYRKSTDANQAMFPRGLYFADGEAITLGRIDPVTMTTQLVAGNQLSMSIGEGSTFGPNFPLGTNYMSTSTGFFDFDPNGLLAFYTSTNRIYRVDSQSLIRGVMTGGNKFTTRSSGSSALGTSVVYTGARSGIVFDTLGRLYSGARPNTSDSNFALGPKLFMVDIASDTFNNVIHGGSNAISADDATPGSAVSKPFSCGNGTASCYIQYDRLNDRLLFAEGNKIRVITTPYAESTSTLSTLMHTDGVTPMTPGRTVVAYEYVAALNRVYYLSGGQLYCYDLAQSSPAIPTCNNTSLGFPSQLGSLSSTAIAVGEGNSEVFVRGTGVIYRYQIDE